MRVRVTVEEWPALRLRYGLQVAEERPEGDVEGRELVPGVSADLTRRTLFGRPLALGGAFVLQRREQTARALVSTPSLFGLPVETSFVGERSREEFAAVTLVSDRSGVAWEQRARLADHLGLAYAYRFERNHTFETEPSMNPDFPAFDVTINIARVTGSAAWDTRDDPTDATVGLLASSSLEWAPESAGSDIRFIRQVSQAYYFRPWRGAVLASAARFGSVRPLGGQELIPSERFFAGGAGTVRGVAEDSLGGVDFFGNPVGGEALLVLNQEARVPIYRWVRGVAFVDAGNVFPTLGDVRVGELAGSIGAGVRIATPFALLRADFGRVIWNGPAGQQGGRWTFGIGHAF
jgi:outer membrane protein assembly factor BamA